jgi:hypothetical protein
MNIQNKSLPKGVHDSGTARSLPTDVNVAQVTVVTAEAPDILTKQFYLDDGVLRKEGGGVLFTGHASVRGVASLSEFSNLLQSLGPEQALIYGVPERSEVGLVTKDAWTRMGEPSNPIPRTKDTFSWPEGPGIMMIDYDPAEDEQPLSADELVSTLKAAVSGLADAKMLTWPSASSWIKNVETGEWMREAGGLRVYLMVANASDIPRAGKALFDRLWLAGRGYFKISSAGSLLERTLVDAAVWQSNRLDFAAGAQCQAPLEQHRGKPGIHAGSIHVVDSAVAIPDLAPNEVDIVDQLKTAARLAREHDALEVRNKWLESRAVKMVADDAGEEEIARARQEVERALETDTLTGSFVIDVELDGDVRGVSVQEILDNPARYDRCRTRDPIEPDYDGGRLVGMLFLSGSTKNLFSFARGERTYRLDRERAVVGILQGRLDEAVNETVEVLRGHPQFYDFGDTCAYVDYGRLYPLDQHRFDQLVSGSVRFVGFDRNGAPYPKDPPPNLGKRILAMGGMRQLKPLKGVITAPTMRLDGSLLEKNGYDPETQLYLCAEVEHSGFRVPDNPTVDQARAALDALMFPFRDFPFAGADDKGVFLSALLTAVVRPVLPTAPGFGFDAPIQASGKSLLANCVAALAGAVPPEIYPPTFGRDDEEIRKRLLSCFRNGASAVVWDNIVGNFDSASLAAAMTASEYTDRILGQSLTVSVPTRMLMLFTGNNLTFQGDMARRVPICRIDPKSDTPFQRSFDLDPLTYVNEHRSELVEAALTLMRASMLSDLERPSGRMASFEVWNDVVRNAVCWVNTVVSPGEFSDPMLAIVRAAERDPEVEALSALLVAIRDKFGNGEFSSSDIQKLMPTYPYGVASGEAAAILEALNGLSEHAKWTSAKIGKLLSYRKDRIADGLVLRTRKDSHSKKAFWRIEEAVS